MYTLIGDGGRQVRLPDPKSTLEQQPALGVGGESFGLVISALDRFALAGPQTDSAVGLEVLKSEMTELLQVAQPEETILDAGLQLRLPAGADQ